MGAGILRLLRVLLLAIAGVLTPLALAAQTVVGGITGTVRDTSGQPVANVVVEAHHGETGYVVQVRTNESGHYAMLGLPLGGPYTLRTRRLEYRRACGCGAAIRATRVPAREKRYLEPLLQSQRP